MPTGILTRWFRCFFVGIIFLLNLISQISLPWQIQYMTDQLIRWLPRKQLTLSSLSKQNNGWRVTQKHKDGRECFFCLCVNANVELFHMLKPQTSILCYCDYQVTKPLHTYGVKRKTMHCFQNVLQIKINVYSSKSLLCRTKYFNKKKKRLIFFEIELEKNLIWN